MKPEDLRAYTPYGFQDARTCFTSVMNFNGERLDCRAGVYLLGNGYRGFSPALMRFVAPDSWSPFGAGGLNSYAYCTGNPVAGVDPSGHTEIRRNPAVLALRAKARDLDPARTQRQARAQVRTPARTREHAPARVQGQAPARVQTRPQQIPPVQASPPDYLNRLVNNAEGYLIDLRIRENRPPLPVPPIIVGSEAVSTPPFTRGQASSLYAELLTTNRHERNYQRGIAYVAQGTELRAQYDRDIASIRERARQIRTELGLDALSWFHF
ncbi:RHS repeat-associated core domain-containing protein [Pseudomonas sp.]|uniref:RHS repeat-associated core domain-containing protein n=1 Tax=Pseudomonas sp. TaxID=306 RepID=UPI003917D571